jgi:branched-chain amino acid transport system substrate-binding protein
MKRLFKILTSLLLGMAWLLVGSSGMTAEPIKVGGLFALSGPAAHIGIAQKNSCRLIFDDVNKEGGINGRMIEFIEADTEGDPTKTLMKTKWLVEEQKVSVIVGPTRTGSGMAIKPYIDKAEVPIFMHAGSDVIIMKPPVHWVFKSPYKTSAALGKVFEYCKKEGLKNIAFMYASDGFGKDGLKNAKKLAPEFGLDIVGEEAFAPKDVDMTAQLTKIKATNAQVIVCWTIGPAGGIVAKNRKQLGMKQPLFQCHGQAEPIFIKVAGDAAEGVMMPATKIYVGEELETSDPQREKILQFVAAFTPEYGPPGVMVSYGADAAYIVVDALKKAGDDRAKIRDAIENTRGYVGLSGIYNISSEDHNGLTIKDVVMLRVEEGKFRLVK